MKEGYLLKRSDNLKRWRNRWFRLDKESGRLLYKESQEDRFVKGVFPLVGVCVGPLQSPSKHLVSLLHSALIILIKQYFNCSVRQSAPTNLRLETWHS